MKPDRHHPATAVNFHLPKRLDALTADGVYLEVRRILSRGAQRLTLDAGAMVYVSSKGIRTLLRLREELHRDDGVLILKNLQTFAQDVLRASGLGDDLTGLDGDIDMVCR
jgi:anti-anti-sigma factor